MIVGYCQPTLTSISGQYLDYQTSDTEVLQGMNLIFDVSFMSSMDSCINQ